eukprot:10383771-Lingulodinium_polyedra.AAC.1
MQEHLPCGLAGDAEQPASPHADPGPRGLQASAGMVWPPAHPPQVPGGGQGLVLPASLWSPGAVPG